MPVIDLVYSFILGLLGLTIKHIVELSRKFEQNPSTVALDASG